MSDTTSIPTNSIPTSSLPDLLPQESLPNSNTESDSIYVQNDNSSASVSVPSVSSDSVNAVYDSSLASSASSVADTTTEIVVQDARPILSTPLDDYTVTEGLLLLVFAVAFVRLLFRFFDLK